MTNLPGLLQLVPEYRDYVWGGQRLRPGQITAEAWVVHAGDQVQSGPLAGRSLGELADEYGERLLGRTGQTGGKRFPLLIKLLDCAQWLSIQVHPNDVQAAALEGPGQTGKTETWHILAAEPGAQLIAGLKPGVTAPGLAEAIRGGGVAELCQYVNVQAGDTAFIRAGTVHALGPGLLIYELQQDSDLTYRVFDWNRPASAGRALHIEKSLAVADPAAVPQVVPAAPQADGSARLLCECAYFRLELLRAGPGELALDTAGRSFHALTAIQGAVRLHAGGESCTLERFQTALVPAGEGAYRLEGLGASQVLLASLPGERD